MKTAVANAGLHVANFAHLTAQDSSDVPNAIKSLELEFPVVVKTPHGMSTMDICICGNMEEAVRYSVNLIASPTTPHGVQVTDILKYNKVSTDGTMVNTWQTMVDLHSDTYATLV
eukprot:11113061-Ditylum_brightwellii.AAC.1